MFPTLLLGFSIVRSDHEEILGMSSLLFGIVLIAAGFLAYALDLALRPARSVSPTSAGMN